MKYVERNLLDSSKWKMCWKRGKPAPNEVGNGKTINQHLETDLSVINFSRL